GRGAARRAGLLHRVGRHESSVAREVAGAVAARIPGARTDDRRRADRRRHRGDRIDRRGDGRRGPMSFHPKMAYGATFHKSSRQLEDEGPAFSYSAENRARFDEIVKRYPPENRRSAVLPALYLAQYQQGYITANAIRHVAELLGITRADVEDVTSFYTMFYTRPVGKFVLQVCRTLSC